MSTPNEIVYKIAQDLLELQKNYSSRFKQYNATLSRGNSSKKATPQVDSKKVISPIEEAILRAKSFPILINETEQVSALGQRGIYANKSEETNWKGEIPLSQYAVNIDDNPKLIKKKVAHQLEYVQELAVRYLRPPTPPIPGEIIIQQEANRPASPAPPIVIRQQPPRPRTPEPLIYREAPPIAPEAVGKKLSILYIVA